MEKVMITVGINAYKGNGPKDFALYARLMDRPSDAALAIYPHPERFTYYEVDPKVVAVIKTSRLPGKELSIPEGWKVLFETEMENPDKSKSDVVFLWQEQAIPYADEIDLENTRIWI